MPRLFSSVAPAGDCRRLGALLALLQVIPMVIKGQGSACLFRHVNQAQDMLPSGPGTSDMTCAGCSLDTAQCSLTCKGGCLLPSGRRGPPASLDLRSCDPATHVIGITSGGGMVCQGASVTWQASTRSPPTSNSPSVVPVNVSGVIHVLMSHRDGPDAPREVPHWQLQEYSGPAMPRDLDFGGEIPELVTGDSVILTVEVPKTAVNGNPSRRLLLSDLNLPTSYTLPVRKAIVTASGSSKDFVVGGKPVALTAAVFSFKFCGMQPSLSPNELRARFFNSKSADPSRSPTMERMFATCSFNKLLLPEATSVVLPVEELNCTGTRRDPYSGQPISWNFNTSCGGNEVDTFRWYAQQLATTKYKNLAPWNSFKRIVMILPYIGQCPWAGLGSTGCAVNTPCTSWIQTDSDLSLPVSFQELMHNTGLYHSERMLTDLTTVAYGETADPMGSCEVDGDIPDGIVCSNAAQAWKAGWATPIDPNMTMANLAIGATTRYTLPALGYSGGVGAMLRVRLYDDGYNRDGSPVRQRALFVSYRARTPVPGYDSALPSRFDQRVAVHQFDGVGLPRTDPWLTPTYLIGLLDAADGPPPLDGLAVTRSRVYTPLLQLRDDQLTSRPDLVAAAGRLGSLNVTFLAKDDRSATVSICRFVDAKEAGQRCTDGVDNDCDGLTDADDPDCADEWASGDFTDFPSPPPNMNRWPSPPPPPPSPPPRPPSPPPRRPSSPPRPPPRRPPPPSPRPPPPSPPPPRVLRQPRKSRIAGRRRDA